MRKVRKEPGVGEYRADARSFLRRHNGPVTVIAYLLSRECDGCGAVLDIDGAAVVALRIGPTLPGGVRLASCMTGIERVLLRVRRSTARDRI